MLAGMRSATTARPHRSVILTKVRIQSHEGPRSVTLDPDFRQDDGVLAAARVAAPATVTSATSATPPPLFTPFSRTMR